jgi:hypothetical protein
MSKPRGTLAERTAEDRFVEYAWLAQDQPMENSVVDCWNDSPEFIVVLSKLDATLPSSVEADSAPLLWPCSSVQQRVEAWVRHAVGESV